MAAEFGSFVAKPATNHLGDVARGARLPGAPISLGPSDAPTRMNRPYGAPVKRDATLQMGTTFRIEHVQLPGDVSRYLQPGELVFRETGYDSTVVDDTVESSGVVGAGTGLYLTLPALNLCMKQLRDLPANKFEELILSRWKLVGVILSVEGFGWSTEMKQGTIACTVGRTGQYPVKDYTKAIDPTLAKQGSYLFLETRTFNVADDHKVKTAASLRADGAVTYDTPAMVNDLTKVTAESAEWPAVPAALVGAVRPFDRPALSYVEGKLQAMSIAKAAQSATPLAKTYIQLIPTVRPTRWLSTPEDSAILIETGQKPPLRICVGMIRTLRHNPIPPAPRILFLKDGVNQISYTDIGSLELFLRFTVAN